jgi:hypothetical protein
MRLPFMPRKQKPAHSHYWLLDEPNGPLTKGICINNTKHNITGCGETKDFHNSHEGSAWKRKARILESSRRGASKGGKAASKERKNPLSEPL